MFIFLLLLMPLFYWGIQYLFESDNVRFADRILPFFYGFILAIPVILLQWALDSNFILEWNPLDIYFYTFFNKEGIITVPILVVLIFQFKNKEYAGTPIREMTAWFCGYYFMFALSEVLVMGIAMDTYIAVFNPLIRLFSIMIIIPLLIRFFHSDSPRIKYSYLTAVVLSPLLINLIPFVELLNKTVLFVLFFTISALGSLFLYIMESRGKFS